MLCRFTLLLLLASVTVHAQQQPPATVTISSVGLGWAGNSINTVVFRKNALVSFRDFQFIAYYDDSGYVNLGKRKLPNGHWLIEKKKYKGNTRDAHNSISIAVDGDGFLHMAWDHHNTALRYCKSVAPYSLVLTEQMTMTGKEESKVSYPEFYLHPSGDLLFFYRDGGSGNGNLIINAYRRGSKEWVRMQFNLLDGEGKRNAYWQACVARDGAIHLSWVWRESPDVASNHDMFYAISKDGGHTWLRSSGEQYLLPINALTGEKIADIPQRSELINQTSMCTDAKGNPIIATYWRGHKNVPQYQLIHRQGKKWSVKDTGFRNSAFSLSGKGTKSIPIARPQVISWGRGGNTKVAIIYRDAERGNKVSLASNNLYRNTEWQLLDLAAVDVGAWEPTYDQAHWQKNHRLHLFVQKVSQPDAEGVSATAPQMVEVLEWRPGG